MVINTSVARHYRQIFQKKSIQTHVTNILLLYEAEFSDYNSFCILVQIQIQFTWMLVFVIRVFVFYY